MAAMDSLANFTHCFPNDCCSREACSHAPLTALDRSSAGAANAALPAAQNHSALTEAVIPFRLINYVSLSSPPF